MRRILVIVLFNVLLTLVVGEILLRVIAPRFGGQIGVAARYVTTGQPYDQTWTPAWTTNRDHYYSLTPDLVDSLQYGSPMVSFKLTTNALWDGAIVGFRTRPIDFFVDGVVVGDSFGLCFTEQSDCWVDLLSTKLSKNLVNLSQPVTGSRSHLKILQDYGAPLKPPLVIWQFFGNDFNDDYGLAVLRDEMPSLTEPKETISSNNVGDWLRHNSVLFAVVETALNGRYLGLPVSETLFAKPYTVRFGENQQHTMMFGGLYEQQALDMSREENQLGRTMTTDALAQAAQLVTTWEGRLVVLIMPTREEVYREITELLMPVGAIDKLQSARDAIRDICTELALTCLDPYEMLHERALLGEALYHVDDLHLNAAGNAALSAWLAEQEVLTF